MTKKIVPLKFNVEYKLNLLIDFWLVRGDIGFHSNEITFWDNIDCVLGESV